MTIIIIKPNNRHANNSNRHNTNGYLLLSPVLSLSLYIHIYTRIHTCTYYIYIYTYTRIHTCTHIYIYIYTHVFLSLSLSLYIYIYICMFFFYLRSGGHLGEMADRSAAPGKNSKRVLAGALSVSPLLGNQTCPNIFFKRFYHHRHHYTIGFV